MAKEQYIGGTIWGELEDRDYGKTWEELSQKDVTRRLRVIAASLKRYHKPENFPSLGVCKEAIDPKIAYFIRKEIIEPLLCGKEPRFSKQLKRAGRRNNAETEEAIKWAAMYIKAAKSPELEPYINDKAPNTTVAKLFLGTEDASDPTSDQYAVIRDWVARHKNTSLAKFCPDLPPEARAKRLKSLLRNEARRYAQFGVSNKSNIVKAKAKKEKSSGDEPDSSTPAYKTT